MARTPCPTATLGRLSARTTVRALRRPYATSSSAQQSSGSVAPPLAQPVDAGRSDKKSYVKDPLAWAVVAGLAGLGGIGLYASEFYKLYKTWPDPVRKPLKQAQKALEADNFVKAERYFSEAYNIARAYKPPIPLLHTTGLASVLASVQADSQRAPQRALVTLQTALSDLDAQRPSALSGAEKLRRLGVLNRLSELAGRMENDDLEEKFGSRAVVEVLRAAAEKRLALGARKVGQPPPPPSQTAGGAAEDEFSSELDDLIPDWLGKTQVGATIDQLAGFYLRKGKADYAAPLYLHAINTILPPVASTPEEKVASWRTSTEDRCRAAMMMSNLSSTLSLNPTTANLEAAHTWASKSLAEIERVLVSSPEFSIGASSSASSSGGLKEGGWFGGKWWMKKADRAKEADEKEGRERGRREMCESVRSVALFNLGLLAEMNKDLKKALDHLRESLKWSGEVGYVEGVREASAALERLEAQ